jgi:tetratricopeptide (TPR) repeat protein
MKAKTRFTTISMAELAGAIVLALVAVFLTLSAIKDFRLRYNMRKGLIFYGSGQTGSGQAVDCFEACVKVRPENPYPWVMLGKLYTDSKAERAEIVYKSAIEKSKDRSVLAASYVGLGVYSMKRADETGDMGMVEQAKGYFQKVIGQVDPDCAEAYIGMGHAFLRAKPNPDIANAKKYFAMFESRQGLSPTLDGLIDYHIGRGVVYAAEADYEKAKVQFQKAYALGPTWKITLANVAYMEARNLSDPTLDTEKYLKQHADEIEKFLRKLREIWNYDRKEYVLLEEAMYSLNTAYATAWSRHPMPRKDKMEDFNKEAQYLRGDNPAAYLNLAAACIRILKKNPTADETEKMNLKMKARDNLDEAFRKCRLTDAQKLIVLNDKAVIELERGAFVAPDQALGWLEEAAKIAPKDYYVRRNLAIGCSIAKLMDKADDNYRIAIGILESTPPKTMSREEVRMAIEELQAAQERMRSGE